MKRSEEIIINNSDERTVAALEMADKFIRTQGLTGKDALHLRLLAEETLGMVQAMTGDFKAIFWIECDELEYRIRLTAKTNMDLKKKNDLLSVSTSGKNAAVKGFMGKIREIIENSSLNYTDVMKFQQEYGSGYVDYGFMGLDRQEGMSVGMNQYVWSLKNYRTALEDAAKRHEPAKVAWDELEKSIVASLAQDVIVGVKKNRVDMIIIKR